jgi:transducin (beta)-like 1
MMIYRYLQESGYIHSAYSFVNESQIGSTPQATAEIPFGSLITLLHKGILYTKLERQVELTSTNGDSNYHLHKKTKLLTPESITTNLSNGNNNNNNTSSPPPLPPPPSSSSSSTVDILVLRGPSKSSVFVCTFNPIKTNLLATGGSEGDARIWDLDNPTHAGCLLECKKDITTACWNPQGTILATGSGDGQVRLWTDKGELITCILLSLENLLPIFSVKWNTNGKLLLFGGQDHCAHVYQLSTKSIIHSYTTLHTDHTLDVDWMKGGEEENNNILGFATASSDKSVCIIKFDTNLPIRLIGHEDEVNTVRWSSDNIYLVSCSDDCSAKIWTEKDNQWILHMDLKGHTQGVYTVRWSPTGPKSLNPTKPRRLATVSTDCTARIWDPDNIKSSCLFKLDKMTEPVYALEYHPSGDLLLTGSMDGLVNIWQTDNGLLIRAIKCDTGVFDVSWNTSGNKFAAASSDGNITICEV